MRLRATRLSAISNALRSVFKIASVNPVLWWDAESHRAALAGGAATLFQDSAGTSAVTVVEQPVGLVLDTRQPQYGPELISNGDFGGGLTGWIASANFSVVGGAARSDGTNSVYAPLRQLGVFVAGKAYEICFDLSVTSGSLPLWIDGQQFVATTSASGRRSFFVKANFSGSLFFEAAPSSVISIDNVSVREVLGVTALQATSTARPVLTARKNLLTYSEQFDNVAWVKSEASVLANVALAPGGGLTADKIVESTVNSQHCVYFPLANSGGLFTFSVYLKAAERAFARIFAFSWSPNDFSVVPSVYVDLTSGTITNASQCAASIVNAGGGWWRVVVSTVNAFPKPNFGFYIAACAAANGDSYVGNGSAGILAWGAMLEAGSTATSYQRVTTATDYDTTAAPLMLRFDGIDDSLASATFAAGTLPADADVYMVMHRHANDGRLVHLSGQSTGVYVGAWDEVYNGLYANGSGATAHAINGRTSLASGPLPLGVPYIFEARSANLSGWASVKVAGYSGYSLSGRIGCLLITPAQPAATRAQIRKALAKAYQIQGVV